MKKIEKEVVKIVTTNFPTMSSGEDIKEAIA